MFLSLSSNFFHSLRDSCSNVRILLIDLVLLTKVVNDITFLHWSSLQEIEERVMMCQPLTSLHLYPIILIEIIKYDINWEIRLEK